MKHVFIFKAVDYLVCTVRVFLVEIVRYFDKRVCCAAHGREDNKCGLTSFCYERRYFLYPFWRTNGSASKFHYFHDSNIFDFRVLRLFH